LKFHIQIQCSYNFTLVGLFPVFLCEVIAMCYKISVLTHTYLHTNTTRNVNSGELTHTLLLFIYQSIRIY